MKEEKTKRINKYLAEKGISTRRGADAMILAGKILINGKKAILGDKVSSNDKVEIVGIKEGKNLKYFSYNKPLGLETKDIEEEIKEILPEGVGRLFPVGRLDKDSSGLIILTNDGRITDRLLNPKSFHEKEYRVVLDHPITNTILRGLKEGLSIGGFTARSALVRKIDAETFDIILTEGQNRQIRRMCRAFSYDVMSLTRFRVMNILLENQKVGTLREIKGNELDLFLKSLGL